MNRDTYTFEERFLAWLLQRQPHRGADSLTQFQVDSIQPRLNREGQFAFEPEFGSELDRVGEVTSAPLHMHQFEETFPRSSGPEPLKLGAKSVVQERYYSLLKQRFQRDLEASPPLFPWESELREYEDSVSISAWEPQLQRLRLPVCLPEAVLTTLFERCQSLAQSAVQDGRRLVEAVESLFPGEAQSLNLLANTVRLGYSRDGEGLDRLLGTQPLDSYEAAAQRQKMTLAMVAAYQVLDRLTLDLSNGHHVASQSWETAAGKLEIRAERVDGLLKVESILPQAGSILVRHDSGSAGAGQSQTHRESAGPVALLVPDASKTAYSLQVRLAEAEVPLGFSIQL